MAQQAARSDGNPVVDLVCVAVLGLVLWFGAQAIGSVARSSSVHAVAPAQAPAH